MREEKELLILSYILTLLEHGVDVDEDLIKEHKEIKKIVEFMGNKKLAEHLIEEYEKKIENKAKKHRRLGRIFLLLTIIIPLALFSLISMSMIGYTILPGFFGLSTLDTMVRALLGSFILLGILVYIAAR